ncbi:hypothetical protein MRB53_040792 [Persea americana]|nr:hypothetical protein MRB53_040792 [Persea americana]
MTGETASALTSAVVTAVGSRISHFPEENGNMFNGDCAIICIAGLLGVHCLPVWMKRSDFRKTHRIRGDGCSDCMVAWCCLPCSVAQLNMEVKDRAASARAGPGAGYAQNHAPMAYKPVA